MTQMAQAAPSENGITAPAEAATVRGVVPVEGIADHAGFRKWQLDLLLNGDTHGTFIAFGEKQVPAPGLLAQLDTTRYPNGRHLLRLRVVYTGLNYDEYFMPIVVDNPNAPPSAPNPEPAAEPNQAPAPGPGPLGANVADGRRWIEIDLSEQTLTAWQGDVAVLHTSVSTGIARYPTVTGTFNIRVKLPATRMTGPGYDLPNVPWTMYFYAGYGIHGTYWHNNFGTPMSHGCVNMRTSEAKLLFDWASVGTEVVVHR